jgi:hypothetical protein
MNLFDPFILFCGIEVIAVVALLVVWLDVGLGCCHIALCSHVTPELVYLFFPEQQEAPPADDTRAAAIEAVVNDARQQALID